VLLGVGAIVLAALLLVSLIADWSPLSAGAERVARGARWTVAGLAVAALVFAIIDIALHGFAMI
jgi:hypothetical protein